MVRRAGTDTTVGDRPLSDRAAAFERFTQARLDRAYRLAAVVLRNRTEAEDAVHDAALVAWARWADLREPARMDAWFDRILINECRSRLRRLRVRPNSLALGSSEEQDVYQRVGNQETVGLALAGLDPEHRIALVLRYFLDLPPAAIAERTGTSVGTVKSRLHYGLRQARAAVEASERSIGESRDRPRG